MCVASFRGVRQRATAAPTADPWPEGDPPRAEPTAAVSGVQPGGSAAAAAAEQRQQQQHLAALGSLSRSLVQDGSQRRFRLSLHLRSFSAGRRLPLGLARVTVALALPPQLAALLAGGAPPGRAPPRLACLRTQPAVDVARGAEVTLPGGQGEAEFCAGLLALATLLARWVGGGQGCGRLVACAAAVPQPCHAHPPGRQPPTPSPPARLLLPCPAFVCEACRH